MAVSRRQARALAATGESFLGLAPTRAGVAGADKGLQVRAVGWGLDDLVSTHLLPGLFWAGRSLVRGFRHVNVLRVQRL
jgi:hypothetical protein